MYIVTTLSKAVDQSGMYSGVIDFLSTMERNGGWTDCEARMLSAGDTYKYVSLPARSSSRLRGPLTLPTSLTAAPPSSFIAMVTTGADIPQELFDEFCEYACRLEPDAAHRYFPVSRKTLLTDLRLRHTQAICGQVCRRWAALSRRHLFRRITLRSRDDWAGFTRILLAPPVSGLPSPAERPCPTGRLGQQVAGRCAAP